MMKKNDIAEEAKSTLHQNDAKSFQIKMIIQMGQTLRAETKAKQLAAHD